MFLPLLELYRGPETLMIGALQDEGCAISYLTLEQENSVQFQLMEISDARIMSAIESGKLMYIRGSAEDEAVLCTDNETFRLRELVTSNMFLVVQKNEMKGTVVGRPSSTMEVSHLARAPGIDQLSAALRAHPYNGATVEEQSFVGLDQLHVEKLYGLIQASNNEITNYLRSQGALVIKDHYRLLGSHLLCRFFELFLNTFVLEDWNLEVPVQFDSIWPAFQQYEDEFPAELTRHIITSHADEKGLLDTAKISRFFAQELLKARPQWDLEDFCDAWDRSLMDVIKPQLPLIPDLFLQDRHPGSGRMEIRRFFRSDLPSDPENRFIALFKTRPRWQYEELIPFIADLGKDTKEHDAIILKHGRFSTSKEVRYITPRSQLLE